MTKEIVYIAQNGELSERYKEKGLVAFKVGHTTSTMKDRERGLNRGTERIRKYAGATLTGDQPWVIVQTILGDLEFEEKLHESLSPHRLGDFSSELKHPTATKETAACDELFAVPPGYLSKYLTATAASIDFTQLCRDKEQRLLEAEAKRTKRQRRRAALV